MPSSRDWNQNVRFFSRPVLELMKVMKLDGSRELMI